MNLKKKISLIVDGGRSKIGIESTVIDLTNKPKILRPGIIISSKIEKFLKLKIKKNSNKSKIKSPGMLKKHYSPGIPVLINQKKPDKKSAFIYLGNKYHKDKKKFGLSYKDIVDDDYQKVVKYIDFLKKNPN